MWRAWPPFLPSDSRRFILHRSGSYSTSRWPARGAARHGRFGELCRARPDENQCRDYGPHRASGAFGRLGLLSPEEVARISLCGLFHRRAVILPGWSNRINRLLLGLIPQTVRIRLMSRVIARELESNDLAAKRRTNLRESDRSPCGNDPLYNNAIQ